MRASLARRLALRFLSWWSRLLRCGVQGNRRCVTEWARVSRWVAESIKVIASLRSTCSLRLALLDRANGVWIAKSDEGKIQPLADGPRR